VSDPSLAAATDAESTENEQDAERETAGAVGPATSSEPPIERRLRIAGVLLILGMAVEGGTLLALDRPAGFLTFASAAGVLIVAGIVYYLWSIVR
jgi:hypothetical protein